ncbi:uncharacterized protein N7477_003152 [Penicillium maclennaniae]|uniref:uncharacterized protein n=1 Tax=Penicillium maclennaniae TaxID=1343394 RepID=UPI0025411630|nr:uncharacterized protein N7477_003152 [Penicillium maclennaniae]KAJ5677519.1 hypothetical protein N7477_003152 [Penicillium maclennaniae]
MSDPLALISNSCFHRRVTFDIACGSLTVSFAEVGCATGPALLFLPGMFASRYVGIPLHALAERAGVRLLVVDRAGMGASTDVPLHQRVSTWVELVPRLLAHLGIARVNLVAHSAGTVFLLNTWAQCRELLNPEVFLLAPWVDTAHSHVTVMQMAQYIPTKAFTFWHQIPRFFVTQGAPMLATSGGLIRKITSRNSAAEETRSSLDATEQGIEHDSGISHAEQAELFRLSLRFMYDESTVGANSEALQCLRKGDSDWGACSDYAQCAQTLAAREQSMDDRMRVRVYFAATDALVGRRGQHYFESCWQAPGVEAIDFVSSTVDGTDHDTLLQSEDVWKAIMASVSGRE